MTCERDDIGCMRLGDLIRALRATKHLSQQRLSNLSGVDKGTINNIENGKTNSLRGEKYEKIAAAFGMTVEEMDALLATADVPIMVSPQTFAAIESLAKAANLTVRAYMDAHATSAKSRIIEPEQSDKAHDGTRNPRRRRLRQASKQ